MKWFGLCVTWSIKVEILAPGRHQGQWSLDLRNGLKVQEAKICEKASFPDIYISLFSLSLQGGNSNSFTLTLAPVSIRDSDMDPKVLCSSFGEVTTQVVLPLVPNCLPSQVALGDAHNQAGLVFSICKISGLSCVVSTAPFISSTWWFYSRLGSLGLSRELSQDIIPICSADTWNTVTTGAKFWIHNERSGLN